MTCSSNTRFFKKGLYFGDKNKILRNDYLNQLRLESGTVLDRSGFGALGTVLQPMIWPTVSCWNL